MMENIAQLVNEIRRHKGVFYPENTDEAYIAYQFRYADSYLKKKGLPVEGAIVPLMIKNISEDLLEVKEYYWLEDKESSIYIPPKQYIDDIVEYDIGDGK